MEGRLRRAIIGAVPDKKPSAVAIVGMGAQFGPWKTLDAYRDRVFGQRGEVDAAPTRWWGSDAAARFRVFFVDEVAFPLGRFRVPPSELAEMLSLQLLMLQAAADAFDDAGLGNVSAERLDTGVFIGIGLDLNTTNFHFRWTLLDQARRWARELDLELTDSEIVTWAAQLREAAGPALNANRTMGALGGIVASRVARAFQVGGPSFTISSEETSSVHAIHTAVGALQRGELNVALAGGVDLAGDLRAVVGEGAATVGEGAAAVVLKRHENALRDGDRVYALIDGDSSVGISMDAASDIGHAGAATGIASVVKAALCLHHEVHGRSYWLHNRADGPRQATVRVSSISGHHAQVSLVAATGTRCDPKLRECFFAAVGQSKTELLENLQQLAQLVADGDGGPFESTARRWFRAQHGKVLRGLCVGFVAESREQMRELISRAREAVETGKRLAGDRVFYSPQPLGADGVAFVFPPRGMRLQGWGGNWRRRFRRFCASRMRRISGLRSSLRRGGIGAARASRTFSSAMRFLHRSRWARSFMICCGTLA